ncbi:MAG: CHAT domain-containing protein [Deltaproteobacteria bacterium]
MKRGGGIVLLCAALACTERRPAPEPELVDLPMRGCVHVSRVCEVGEAPLVFYAEDAKEVRAALDGTELTTRTATLATGVRVSVDVPARRGTLTLSILGDVPRLMRVSVDAVPADVAVLTAPTDRTSGARRTQDSSRAEAIAKFAEARRLYKEGDAEAAMAALTKSAELADRASLRSQAARSRLLAVWIAARSLRDFEAARSTLDRVPKRSPYDSEADVLRAFHVAVVASEVGDRRSALAAAGPARMLARTLGLNVLATRLEMRELNTLHELGRFDEAATRWRSLVRQGTGDGCLDVLATGNLGWSLMRASKGSEEARVWLEAALAADESRCTDPPPTRRANLLVNSALLALERKELDRAQAALDSSRRSPMLPEHAQWAMLIDASIALERGDVKRALADFWALAERADATRLTEIAWHAWVGVGRSRQALGDLDGAAEAYAAAEARTAREAVLVPVDGGRQHLYGDREESARRWVALEIDRGRPKAAFDVVRRARRRTLASIELARRIATLDGASRTRWERDVARYRRTRQALEDRSATLWLLPKSERAKQEAEVERSVAEARRALDEAIGKLARTDVFSTLASERGDPTAAPFRSPAEGEVMVAWYPLAEGWAVFAVSREGVVVERLVGEPTPDAIVGKLRGPIAAARRVTVLAPGGVDRFALHLGRLGGEPLARRKLVAYALDLPPREERSNDRKSALVVSDPRGDLRAARDEGTRVATNLSSRGWSVSRAQSDEATRRRLLVGLTRVELLHYAGHGTFGGHEGWESSLRLADGRVTVGDILTSTAAPATVLLLGCRTAESSDVGASAGLGIAQAFVLAGARAVVAATREIDDEAAAEVSARISSALDDGSDLLTTYQRSVHGTDDDVPERDAIVVLTP